jgi:2-polyprenyl-3-methyl-5-hydroxy-6-metoxy-1,4-benzoquinol methylase
METMAELRRFWSNHYEQVFATSDEWLDFSNERVQNQTFGVCLEAAATVQGRRCLDLGCGRGQFSRVLLGCGGIVTAVDATETARVPVPGIEWREGNLLDEDTLASLPKFERVFMLEVLQYLPLDTIARVWAHVEPGGRLVGVIPNSECPIVQKTVERFQGRYLPQSPESLLGALGALPDLALAAMRGLTFGDSQEITPYRLSSWYSTSPDDLPVPPNRLQFVAIRK